MKAFIISLFLTLSTLAIARNIVPNSNGQGQIGDTNAYWDGLYVNSLFLNGANVNTLIPTNQGVTTINNLKGNVEVVAGTGFRMFTNDGSKVYLNLFTNTFVVGTNIATYRYTGGDQYFQVPNNVTNMRAWLWGGAGAGSGSAGAGGYTEVGFRVLPFEILTIVVGQGGRIATGTTTSIGNTGRVYPDGGAGISRTTAAGSGGGRSQILRGSLSITNESRTVAVAAGGGGSTAEAGGAGGGENGGAGAGTTAGGGAAVQYAISSITTNFFTNDTIVTTSFVYNISITNFTGGSSQVTTNLVMFWTNRAGSLFSGGDGGVATNTTTARAGGGGGGWYGGGGGSATATTASASGGGGMGFINTNLQAFGRTIRGIGANPAGTENAFYISGAGTGQALGSPLRSDSSTNFVSGHGLIILQY